MYMWLSSKRIIGVPCFIVMVTLQEISVFRVILQQFSFTVLIVICQLYSPRLNPPTEIIDCSHTGRNCHIIRVHTDTQMSGQLHSETFSKNSSN